MRGSGRLLLQAVRPPFISAKSLAQSTRVPIDGTWFMPNVKRSAYEEFLVKRIPSARFFNLDAICDTSSPFPHMFPTPARFSESMSGLGIKKSDDLCIYDTVGLFSAARVYFTLKVFGHAGDVKILEGGLPAYIEAGLPLATSKPETIEAVEYGDVEMNRHLVVDFEEIQDIVASKRGATQILDARPAARFTGEAPEPRAGLSSGHMPHSISLPFSDLQRDGKLLDSAELRRVLQSKEIDLDAPIVTSCGTGVTACVLSVALESLGVESRVYDESWTGYATRAADLPGMIHKDV